MESTTPEDSAPSRPEESISYESIDYSGFLGDMHMDYSFPDLSSTLYTNTYGAFSSSSLTSGGPMRPYTPPPVDTTMYPLPQANRSASDVSSDGRSSRASRNSGANSPGPSSSIHRYNPIASSRTRARRSTRDRSASDDAEDDYAVPAPSIETRSEATRRQRIEAEQRHRDELRDGYRRLKDVLPVSNQKASKVSILDRASAQLKYLDTTLQQLLQRLNQSEAETQRLRTVNEALMLGTAEQRSASELAAAAVSLAAQVHHARGKNDVQPS